MYEHFTPYHNKESSDSSSDQISEVEIPPKRKRFMKKRPEKKQKEFSHSSESNPDEPNSKEGGENTGESSNGDTGLQVNAGTSNNAI